MFGAVEYEHVVKFIETSQTNKKFVCAKIIKRGDTVFCCKDCFLHPTCIICEECFENGEHEGHRISMSKDLDGCCDCGDPESWKPSGFCKDHCGYSEEAINQLKLKMPKKLIDNTLAVFKSIIQNTKKMIANARNHEQTIDYDLKVNIVRAIIKFLKWTIDLSPVYLWFLEQSIIFDATNEIDFEAPHICCSDKRYRYYQNVYLASESDNVHRFCECSLFDLIFDI